MADVLDKLELKSGQQVRLFGWNQTFRQSFGMHPLSKDMPYGWETIGRRYRYEIHLGADFTVEQSGPAFEKAKEHARRMVAITLYDDMRKQLMQALIATFAHKPDKVQAILEDVLRQMEGKQLDLPDSAH